MRRGEVWLADAGRGPRPVLIMTRDEVLEVWANVTVAEVTIQVRGLAVEVPIGAGTGIDQRRWSTATACTPWPSEG